MSSMKCSGCGGVYETVQADGLLYYHTCPPGTDPANARDENRKSTKADATGTIKAEGKGVVAVAETSIRL